MRLGVFLFQLPPRERGLVETTRDDSLRYWTFPPDYPERIIGIVEGAVAASRERARTGIETSRETETKQ